MTINFLELHNNDYYCAATFPGKSGPQTRLFRASAHRNAEFAMHDTLTAARERARLWREAQDDTPVGGVVLLFDGHFLGWLAQLPPAAQWAPGCLAIEGDGRVHLLQAVDFRGGVEWLDLGTPEPLESTTEPTSYPLES
jgi:hypothetical protein